MTNEQIVKSLAVLPLLVRGSRDEVFKAIRDLQQEARKANAAPAAPSPAEPICSFCEHPASEHARGQMRRTEPCEYPDCECGNYDEPAALRTSVEERNHRY